jgi:hypothetical protein
MIIMIHHQLHLRQHCKQSKRGRETTRSDRNDFDRYRKAKVCCLPIDQGSWYIWLAFIGVKAIQVVCYKLMDRIYAPIQAAELSKKVPLQIQQANLSCRNILVVRYRGT